MKDWDTIFIVPLGVGADLEYWGIPAAHIVDVDWWDRVPVRGVTIVCTPSRHASGRGVTDKDAKRLGPFDLTMIEVGQYNEAWPDWHMGPEQAVLAHRMVRGNVFLPVHWGALALAAHAWTEPVERALVAAHEAGVAIATPKPGESFDPGVPRDEERWWPKVPWKTAEEDPIVSSQME